MSSTSTLISVRQKLQFLNLSQSAHPVVILSANSPTALRLYVHLLSLKPNSTTMVPQPFWISNYHSASSKSGIRRRVGGGGK